jgi:hypothetical protein
MAPKITTPTTQSVLDRANALLARYEARLDALDAIDEATEILDVADEVEAADTVDEVSTDVDGPEPVTAATGPNLRGTMTSKVAASRPGTHSPQRRSTGRTTFGNGLPLDEKKIAESLCDARYQLGNADGSRVLAARLFASDFDGPRVGRNADANAALVASTRPQQLAALTASGGLCGPVPGRFEQRRLSTMARPVTAALTRIPATRGGVWFHRPPEFGDATGAVGVWTHANDVTPGSDGPATKPILRIECHDDTEVLVDAITRGLEVGNFQARWSPEWVEAWVDASVVAHAALAEETILARMIAASTAVNTGQVLGAAVDVPTACDRIAAQFRSHFRMDPSAQVQCVLPAWVNSLMRTDFTRRPPGDRTHMPSDDAIRGSFTRANVLPTFALDWQRFGTQGPGPVIGWPTTVDVLLWSAGSWGWLDGGELDLGVTRDKTLVGTNDAVLFAESFENVLLLDGFSVVATIDVCANGAVPSAWDIDICTTGS